jgi:hypothetical protein
MLFSYLVKIKPTINIATKLRQRGLNDEEIADIMKKLQIYLDLPSEVIKKLESME